MVIPTDHYTRIKKLLDVFVNLIISDERESLHNFLSVTCNPRSDSVSFGHDIEASWLLIEASNVIPRCEEHGLLKEKCRNICEGVLHRGMDEEMVVFLRKAI